MAALSAGARRVRSAARGHAGHAVLVAAVSLIAMLWYLRIRPGLPWDSTVIRVAASLSAIWSVCGWAAHARHEADPARDIRAASSRVFFGAALVLALLAVAIIIPLLGAPFASRLFSTGAEAVAPGRGVRAEGPADVVALFLALLFWRWSRRDARQALAALILGMLLIVWLSLLIPGGLLGDPPEFLVSRPPWAPSWLLWTHVLEIGLAGLLVGAVWWRDASYRRARAGAWPDSLATLTQPYPAQLSLYLVCALYAALALVLGVYHLVRPGGVTLGGGLVGFIALLAAAVACLYWAHRDWSENLAGLGLALACVAVVTLACLFSPDRPGTEFAARLPRRLSAALIGLAAVSMVYLWLPRFWRQQLLPDGQAWTTAGRMIPLVMRAGFMIAATGVLVGYHLALWPRHRVAAGETIGIGQWTAGLVGYAMLARITARAARTHDNPPLAVLSLCAVIAAILFVFVRWPAGALRGAAMDHAAIVLAGAAGMTWGLARYVQTSSWRVFGRPLWYCGLLVLPALALLHATGRPAAEWLSFSAWLSGPSRIAHAWIRPTTLAIVAGVYGMAAWRERRGYLRLLTLALAAAAGVSFYLTYRMAWRNWSTGP